MKIKKFGNTYFTKFWKNEKLNPALLAIDTETSLITSPAIIPDLILTTVYDGSDFVYMVKNQNIPAFMEINQNALFCMFNAAFDIPVLETKGANFDSIIANSRLLDGQILYRLLNIAVKGEEARKWSLDYVTEEFTKEILSKDDEIRLTFGQYAKNGIVNYEEISEKHIEYACLDPIATYICTQKILKQISGLPTSTNLAHQINLLGDLALAQVTRNGIHIDQKRVELINSELENDKVRNEEILATYGYLKGKKGNTKVLEDICKQNNFALPVTESGKMSTAKQYLEDYKSNPFIEAYLKFKGFSKLQNFLNDLNSPIVHPRYNTIKVTSRTSCSKPNFQQLPRIGGIRECFIPENGNKFIICDYSMIELCALASVCLKLFKYSIMADKINLQQDLHKYLASKIYSCKEEEVTKEQRQFAKIGNFGFGADMGIPTFISHAAKSGYILSIDEATKVKQAYLEAYPEMKLYFKRAHGRDTFLSDTGLIRANCSYTQYLNCAFQTKAAEGAKLALYSLVKSNYKVVAFIHDEVVIEVPYLAIEEAFDDIKLIMIEAMSRMVVGVKISVEGKITETYEK